MQLTLEDGRADFECLSLKGCPSPLHIFNYLQGVYQTATSFFLWFSPLVMQNTRSEKYCNKILLSYMFTKVLHRKKYKYFGNKI